MTPEQVADDTLTLDAIRRDITGRDDYAYCPNKVAVFLLAHIDALTAAVKELPGTDVTGRALAYPGGGSLVSRAAVLVMVGFDAGSQRTPREEPFRGD